MNRENIPYFFYVIACLVNGVASQGCSIQAPLQRDWVFKYDDNGRPIRYVFSSSRIKTIPAGLTQPENDYSCISMMEENTRTYFMLSENSVRYCMEVTPLVSILLVRMIEAADQNDESALVCKPQFEGVTGMPFQLLIKYSVEGFDISQAQCPGDLYPGSYRYAYADATNSWQCTDSPGNFDDVTVTDGTDEKTLALNSPCYDGLISYYNLYDSTLNCVDVFDSSLIDEGPPNTVAVFSTQIGSLTHFYCSRMSVDNENKVLYFSFNAVNENEWSCLPDRTSTQAEVTDVATNAGYKAIRLTSNHCDDVPCANGGTCIQEIGGYTCQCTTGWAGQDCKTDPNDPMLVADPVLPGNNTADDGNTDCENGHYVNPMLASQSTIIMYLTYDATWQCFLADENEPRTNTFIQDIEEKVAITLMARSWFQGVNIRSLRPGSIVAELYVTTNSLGLGPGVKTDAGLDLQAAIEANSLGADLDGTIVHPSGYVDVLTEDGDLASSDSPCFYYNEASVCQNGGSCYADNLGSPKCLCAGGYSLPYCRSRDDDFLLIILLIVLAIVVIIFIGFCIAVFLRIRRKRVIQEYPNQQLLEQAQYPPPSDAYHPGSFPPSSYPQISSHQLAPIAEGDDRQEEPHRPDIDVVMVPSSPGPEVPKMTDSQINLYWKQMAADEPWELNPSDLRYGLIPTSGSKSLAVPEKKRNGNWGPLNTNPGQMKTAPGQMNKKSWGQLSKETEAKNSNWGPLNMSRKTSMSPTVDYSMYSSDSEVVKPEPPAPSIHRLRPPPYSIERDYPEPIIVPEVEPLYYEEAKPNTKVDPRNPRYKIPQSFFAHPERYGGIRQDLQLEDTSSDYSDRRGMEPIPTSDRPNANEEPPIYAQVQKKTQVPKATTNGQYS